MATRMYLWKRLQTTGLLLTLLMSPILAVLVAAILFLSLTVAGSDTFADVGVLAFVLAIAGVYMTQLIVAAIAAPPVYFFARFLGTRGGLLLPLGGFLAGILVWLIFSVNELMMLSGPEDPRGILLFALLGLLTCAAFGRVARTRINWPEKNATGRTAFTPVWQAAMISIMMVIALLLIPPQYRPPTSEEAYRRLGVSARVVRIQRIHRELGG